MIATSEIRISCVVPEDDGIGALQAVHKAFGLNGESQIKRKGTGLFFETTDQNSMVCLLNSLCGQFPNLSPNREMW